MIPEPRLLEEVDLASYAKIRAAMFEEVPCAFASSPYERMASHPSAVAVWLREREHDIIVIDHPAKKGELATILGVRRESRRNLRHKAHAWGVYTVPELRGQGFGYKAMSAAIELVRSWGGVDVLHVRVAGESPEALELYETLGFREWAHEADCVRIDGVSYPERRLVLRLDESS